jgi:hypothetical protein
MHALGSIRKHDPSIGVSKTEALDCVDNAAIVHKRGHDSFNSVKQT